MKGQLEWALHACMGATHGSMASSNLSLTGRDKKPIITKACKDISAGTSHCLLGAGIKAMKEMDGATNSHDRMFARPAGEFAGQIEVAQGRTSLDHLWPAN